MASRPYQCIHCRRVLSHHFTMSRSDCCIVTESRKNCNQRKIHYCSLNVQNKALHFLIITVHELRTKGTDYLRVAQFNCTASKTTKYWHASCNQQQNKIHPMTIRLPQFTKCLIHCSRRQKGLQVFWHIYIHIKCTYLLTPTFALKVKRPQFTLRRLQSPLCILIRFQYYLITLQSDNILDVRHCHIVYQQWHKETSGNTPRLLASNGEARGRWLSSISFRTVLTIQNHGESEYRRWCKEEKD